jgi:hypothetical protein
MKEISFCGSIETADPEKIRTVLKEWLKAESLDFRVRMEGWSVVYEDDRFYLYCYEAGSRDGYYFLMEGREQHSTLEMTRVRLLEMVNICRVREIECIIDYSEIDEKNRRTSEEFTVKWTK